MSALDGIWAKLDRAKEHLQALDQEIDGFLYEKPYRHVLDLDPQTGDHIGSIQAEQQAPLLRWGLILGEAIHNARSALDHLVWQLVILNGKKPRGRTAFPIYADPADFKKNVWDHPKRGPLHGVARHEVANIETCQPYRRTNPAERDNLLALNGLWNVDKHRVVLASIIRTPDHAPAIEFKGDVSIKDFEWFSGVSFESGAKIMRLRLSGKPDPHMEMGGHLPIDIAFGERLMPRRRLLYIIESPARIIRSFENRFS